MDRNTMLIVEANEISADLQKEYEFCKGDAGNCENHDEMRVKVINKTLSISCTWSFEKFKERLNKMRNIYMKKLMYKSEQRSTHTDATNLHFQTDSDTSEVDAVFFDPDDVWEKEAADTQVSFTQRKQTVMDESRSSADCSGVVPDVINIRTKKHLSPADAEAQRCVQIDGKREDGIREAPVERPGSPAELPAESEFLPRTPCASPDILTYGLPTDALPGKPEASQPTVEGLNVQRDAVQQVARSGQDGSLVSGGHGLQGSGTLLICAGLAERLVCSLQTMDLRAPEATFLDKILDNCDCINTSVGDIVKAFSSDGSQDGESQIVQSSSIQLVLTMELLVSNSTCLLSSFETGQSASLSTVRQNLDSQIKSSCILVTAFLKACSGQTEDSLRDCASDLSESLFQVVKLCGELCLALEVRPYVLRESKLTESSVQRADPDKPEGRVAVEAALLAGCDRYVEQSLRDALRSVRSCEATVEREADRAPHEFEEILKNTEIIIATTKILIFKYQEIQIEASSKVPGRCENNNGPKLDFSSYFERCRGIIAAGDSLSGSISLLTQAAHTAVSERDAGSARRVTRCAEMVRRAASRLLGHEANTLSPPQDHGSDASDDAGVNSKPLCSALTSILSEEQSVELEKAESDVKVSVEALVQCVRQRLCGEDGTGKSPGRRLLPVTPGVGRGLVRAQSARGRGSGDRGRAARPLSMHEMWN